MLYLVIAIIGIILTILFVVGTHEAAHFGVAKLLGVKVLRFSIGFGKPIFSWHDKSGTEYVFAWIPLGGYVRMLDESEADVAKHELPYAYNRQPFYKKFLIVLAGPAINLICALILYWFIFVIGFVTVKPVIGAITPNSIAAVAGLKPNQVITQVDQHDTNTWVNIIFRLMRHVGNKDNVAIHTTTLADQSPQTYSLNMKDWVLDGLNPDPLASLGIKPYEPALPLVIGAIKPDSPATHAKLQIGDKILAIDKQPIKNWEQLITLVSSNPDKTVLFAIERQHKTLQLPVILGSHRGLTFNKTGYLGISPTFDWPKEYLHKIQYSPLHAISAAWDEVYNLTYFNFLLFGKLITGKLSFHSLGGPIMIFESAGDALNTGFLTFIGFLAFLSIAIGVINLLPIPGLDGGHLFIQVIELIIQKPLSMRVILFMYRLGFAVLLFILLNAVANDVMRLHS